AYCATHSTNMAGAIAPAMFVSETRAISWAGERPGRWDQQRKTASGFSFHRVAHANGAYTLLRLWIGITWTNIAKPHAAAPFCYCFFYNRYHWHFPFSPLDRDRWN